MNKILYLLIPFFLQAEVILNNNKCHISILNNNIIKQDPKGFCPKNKEIFKIYNYDMILDNYLVGEGKTVSFIFTKDKYGLAPAKNMGELIKKFNIKNLKNIKNNSQYSYFFKLKKMYKDFYKYPVYKKIKINNIDYMFQMLYEDFQFYAGGKKSDYLVVIPFNENIFEKRSEKILEIKLNNFIDNTSIDY